jgi:hypoxanthine phosphoribosyltransferase
MKFVFDYTKNIKYYKLFIIIFCILCYHYFIQNNLEKYFFDLYLNHGLTQRPLQICNANTDIYGKFSCLGFPSRHTELASIFFFILYFQKIISLPVCIIFIFFFAFQRILVHMHTYIQITAAVMFGLLYSKIYTSTHFSIYSILFVFLIGICMAILSVKKIDEQLKTPVPSWVSPHMYPTIKNKLNVPYYIKLLTIYANAYETGNSFVSWYTLESMLDTIIKNIQNTGVQYDGVVGIKTGGAILSDYVSYKLGLPNYKVKLSRKEYSCNKNPHNVIQDFYQKQIMKNYGKYEICEGIQEDIRGKNMIVIDELVSTGSTMHETMNYLINEKHVSEIYPTCISFSKQKYKKDIHINYILSDTVFVWPWGYDN